MDYTVSIDLSINSADPFPQSTTRQSPIRKTAKLWTSTKEIWLLIDNHRELELLSAQL